MHLLLQDKTQIAEIAFTVVLIETDALEIMESSLQ